MDYLYFNEYEKHPDAKINPTLLWEYNLAGFDFQKMRDVVVQRVIERGWPNDWYFVLNLYGEDAIKQTIKRLPFLSDKDANFMSKVFKIPRSKMKCYQKKDSQQADWNS